MKSRHVEFSIGVSIIATDLGPARGGALAVPGEGLHDTCHRDHCHCELSGGPAPIDRFPHSCHPDPYCKGMHDD